MIKLIKRRIVASIVLIPLLMVSMFVYQSDIDEDRSIAQMDPPINMDMKIPDSYFIKNEGQIDNEEILYYSANGIVFFTSTGITYKFS